MEACLGGCQQCSPLFSALTYDAQRPRRECRWRLSREQNRVQRSASPTVTSSGKATLGIDLFDNPMVTAHPQGEFLGFQEKSWVYVELSQESQEKDF